MNNFVDIAPTPGTLQPSNRPTWGQQMKLQVPYSRTNMHLNSEALLDRLMSVFTDKTFRFTGRNKRCQYCVLVKSTAFHSSSLTVPFFVLSLWVKSMQPIHPNMTPLWAWPLSGIQQICHHQCGSAHAEWVLESWSHIGTPTYNLTKAPLFWTLVA